MLRVLLGEWGYNRAVLPVVTVQILAGLWPLRFSFAFWWIPKVSTKHRAAYTNSLSL